jgi:hypothetical protein
VFSQLSEEDKRDIHILATSRFDATNIAIWIDEPQLDYELGPEGSTYQAEWAPEEANWIVATGGIVVTGEIIETLSGDGFVAYRIR